MTALNVLRLMSFLTSSNNPLTYFIDSMSHTRQSASALAAKVETLLKLADLRGNRTPTLAYFVMPLSYLLSHSSSILPFASPLYFSCCFPVPTALFRARQRAVLMQRQRIAQVTQVQLAVNPEVRFLSSRRIKAAPVYEVVLHKQYYRILFEHYGLCLV